MLFILQYYFQEKKVRVFYVYAGIMANTYLDRSSVPTTKRPNLNQALAITV